MKKLCLLNVILFSFLTILTAQQLQGSWSGELKTPVGELTLVLHIQDSAGVYTAVLDSPDQNATGIPATKITFENQQLHVEVAHGAILYDGKLLENDSIRGTFQQSGMSIPLTLHKGAVKEKVLQRPQHPTPPFPYASEEVTFSNAKADGIRLAGTLTRPVGDGPFPAVVLISGSGPQDRDETIMGHKPFWVLADDLTRKGIAVLRYDDRGTAASQGDFSAGTTADFATDAAAAVSFLQKRRDINSDKIGLLGHSEGGIVASMVAAENQNIAFVVLLAAPGVDGREILMDQSALIAEASGASQEQVETASEINRRIYDILLQEDRSPSVRDSLIQLLASGMPESTPKEQRLTAAESHADQLMSPWFRYFLSNDPTRYLEKVRAPVLAIGGGKDLQVPAEENIDAIKRALKKAGNTRVTTKIYPELNHLFQHATTGLMNEYGESTETMAPIVLETVGDWIVNQVR